MKSTILYTHNALIEKSKSGDRSAQYELYTLYVDAMYNTALRIVKHKEDAEDIIQESFINAFKYLQSFRYDSTFGSWLKKIVIHKSINHLKLKKIPVSPLSIDEESVSDEEEIPFVPHEINMDTVKKGISLLPDGYQQVINLYLLEGYDHIEISEILGISTNTSKSQYHRAKKKLIQIINTL